MTDTLDPDHVHRTALLAMHDGSAPTMDEALAAQQASRILICADTHTDTCPLGQAALLTAILTAVRTFGVVDVITANPAATVLGGAFRGQQLHQVILSEGAHLQDAAALHMGANQPVVLVGAATEPPLGAAPALRATWSSWRATVSFGAPEQAAPNEPGCVVAAIASGALAVAEAFGRLRAQPGSDSGYRTINLDLWMPGSGSPSPAPPLAYAPHAWWLVGLGHLGQAYAWTISWLPYTDPRATEIVLQDTDRATPANHSTGLLTPREPRDVPKTRMVAPALEAAGLTTRIIERRLGPDLRTDRESHVALLGVDNLPTRRLTSGVGWALAVDAGLGSGAQDFTSILIRRFPGDRASHEIEAWTAPPPIIGVPSTAAFSDLAEHHDECGVVDLAGKAVGASFVGVIAACLVVSETVRELNGGDGHDFLTVDLTTDTLRCSPATSPIEPVSAPLDHSRPG